MPVIGLAQWRGQTSYNQGRIIGILIVILCPIQWCSEVSPEAKNSGSTEEYWTMLNSSIDQTRWGCTGHIFALGLSMTTALIDWVIWVGIETKRPEIYNAI